MRTRREDLEQQAAISRRLALLGDELAGVRSARPEPPPAPPTDAGATPWWDEHTRPAPSRRPPEVPAVVARQDAIAPPIPLVPHPGRHAARRATVRPTPALALPHLTVVAVVVALGLAVTCWWLVRGDPQPADEVRAAPAVAGLVTPGAEVAEPAADTADTADAADAADSPAATGTSGAPATVTVDVAGKVRRPGIAVLDQGARVADALAAAGGARPGVDVTGLNLARVLVDGEQVLVGVDPPPGAAATLSPSVPGTVPTAPGALVDLNTADASLLDTLPEVGPVTAASILAWRDEHGGFSSVDELLEVDGIGEATLDKIAPLVTV